MEEHFVPITVRRDEGERLDPASRSHYRPSWLGRPAAGLGTTEAGLCPSRSGVVHGWGFVSPRTWEITARLRAEYLPSMSARALPALTSLPDVI